MSKTLFYNAKVYVEKDTFAQAVYQEDGWIKAVGSIEDVCPLAAEDAEKIDCEGRVLVPGFNDSHMHMCFTGENMLVPDLSKVHNKDELVAVIKKYVDDNPGITGVFSQSFDQNRWDDPTLPTCKDLDAISTDIPINIARSCGHIGISNSYILKQLGIDKDHKTWDGGRIDCFEDGTPNGIMAETPNMAARMAVPSITFEQEKKALVTAMEYAAAHGMTSCQSNDMGVIIKDQAYCYKIVDEVFAEGKGLVRYHSQTYVDTPEELKEKMNDPRFYKGSFHDGWFTTGPLKLLKDGSYGGHSAFMRRDYDDQPGNRGVENIPDGKMYEMVKIANENGIGCAIHCIGDAALEKVTDCYARVQEELFGDKANNPCRNAIVHCQTMDATLRQKVADANIQAMYQPVFIRTDMYGLEERIGKAMCYTSNSPKTMRAMGIHVSYGTDSPVEDCNPLVNLYVAVTRKDMAGKPEGGWYPDECEDVQTAVDAYTYESAWAQGMEGVKGRIKPGYYADLTVLDHDIFTCDPMLIKDTLPVLTMCGGKFTYRK